MCLSVESTNVTNFVSNEFELFEYAPVPLWESDYSEVKSYFELDWAKDIDNMEQFLLQNPTHFERCMQRVKILNLNQEVLRMFKAESKKQLILGLEQVYTEQGVVAFAKVLSDIYHGKKEGYCRNQMQDLQGEYHMIDIRWSIPDAYQHNLRRVLVSTTLVSEEEQHFMLKTKHKIKQIPERFKQHALQRAYDVLENCPDFVGYGDFTANNIIYMNSAGRKMLGISPEADMSQYEITQFHKPEFFTVVENEIMPLIKQHKVWTGQSEFISLSGEVIPIIQVIIPHVTSDGMLIGTSTIGTDLREIKQAEATVLEQQKQLANIYRIHSMSEVASSIAHEINQPLTAMSNYANGCLNLLAKESVPQNVIAGIEGIVEQARRAGEIVHHIKNYLSRGELRKQPVNINELVQSSVRQSNVAGKENLVLDFQLAEQLPIVQADKLYLQQVFVNLLNNAIDAIWESGTKPGVIKLKTQLNNDKEIMIAVSDNGIGMTETIKEKIFTPLYTRKNGGTGIGLALVRYIVEQHGGKIVVKSVPNEGSEFRILLPVSQD